MVQQWHTYLCLPAYLSEVNTCQQMMDHNQPNPPQLQPAESDLESCDLHPIEPVKVRLTTYTRHSSPSPLRLPVEETPPTSPEPKPVHDLQKLIIPTRRPRYRVPRSHILSRCQVLESSPTPLRLDSKAQHVQYLTRSQTRQLSPSPLTLMNIHQDARYLTRSRVRLWKQRGKQPCPVHGKIIRRQLPRHQSTPKLQSGHAMNHHRHSPGKVKAKQDLFRDSSSDARRNGQAASYVPSPRRMKTKLKDKDTAPRRMGFVTKMRNLASRVQKTVSKAVSKRRAVDVTTFSNVQQTSDVQWVELNSRQKQNYFTGSTEDLDSTLPVTCFRAKKVKVTKPNPAKAHIKRLMKVKQQRSISTPARAKRLSMLQSTSQVPLIRSQDDSTTSTASCQQETSALKPSTSVDEPATQGCPNRSDGQSPSVPPIIIKKTAVVTTKPSCVTERVPPIIIRRTSTVVNPLSPQDVSTSTQESSCDSSCLTEASQASMDEPTENSSQSSQEEPLENASQASLDEPSKNASNSSCSGPDTASTAHQQPNCISKVQRPRNYKWIPTIVRSKIQRIIEGAQAESESSATHQPTGIIPGMNQEPHNPSQSPPPTRQGSSVTNRPQPAPRVSVSGKGQTARSPSPVQTSHVVSVSYQPPVQTSHVVSAKQPSTAIASSRKEPVPAPQQQSQLEPAKQVTAPSSQGAPATAQPNKPSSNQPGSSITLQLNLLPNTTRSIKEEAATFLVYFTTYGQTREQLKSLIARTFSQHLMRGHVLRRETLIVIFNYLLKKNLLRRQDVYSIQLYIRQQWLMIQQSSNGKSSSSQTTNSSTRHQVGSSAQTVPSSQKMPSNSAEATRPSTSSTSKSTLSQPSKQSLLKAPPSTPVQKLLGPTPKIPAPQISPLSKESTPVWKMSARTLPLTELAHQISATGQEDSAAAAQQMSATTRQKPATTEKKSATTQQISATNQLMPSTTQQISATSLLMPSTTQQISATSLLMPATTMQMPATTQQMPATTQQMPATTQQMPATTQQISATTQQMPATIHQMSAMNQLMPATTKQISATTQLMPATTQQMPATTKQMSAPTQPSTTVPRLLSSSTLMSVPQMAPLSIQISAPDLQVSASVTQMSAQRLSAPNLQFTASTLLIPATTHPLTTSTLANHASTHQASFIQPATLSSAPEDPASPNISANLQEPLDVHHQMPPSSPTSVTSNPVRALMFNSTTTSHSQPLWSQDKQPSSLGLVIPSIRVHQNERSLHDDIRELDILSASKSKKRSYPEDSDDADLYPLQKKRFSYSDFLPTNRAWCSSSVKSDPKVCKKCDGINEILHETPANLDKYWISRPTERSPEKNWCNIIPRLCSQTDGRPHLLAKGLVWRLFTIGQLYGNRFHSLDDAVTSKIRLIVQSRTGCDGDYWRRRCVPFINSSIRQLFNNKLRKYEHLLNHTCCPGNEQMTSATPNTCTDIVPYRS
ncbi:mucin-12-like [Crassostrea angulata]|uniref:mucin-12-like n=1 Tax=Magallana angulata TaxID=2784310 RepID=UPI0022B20EA8|nr:mucin-12-like [Crassostrea angulata]